MRTVKDVSASFAPVGITGLKVLNPVRPKHLHQPFSFPCARAIDALLGMVDELEKYILDLGLRPTLREDFQELVNNVTDLDCDSLHAGLRLLSSLVGT